MKDFAKNIKQLREELGLTQRQLADAVGVSQSMIAQIERGTKSCTLPLGAEIATVFGCTLDRLGETNHTDAESA